MRAEAKLAGPKLAGRVRPRNGLSGEEGASRSLTEEVAGRLRDDILTCRLPPDTRLRTMPLCAEFGVSLAVIREALSRLAAEGLVVAEPQRSFRVVPVSPEDLRDLSWMRIELETLAIREAIAMGTLEWETEIVASFHRLSRTPLLGPAAPPEAFEAWAAAHAQFHHALIAACGNSWLLQLRTMLFSRSERYRRLSGLAEDKGRDIAGEHRRIMEATLARDLPRAVAELERHLQRTADLVQATFWPAA